MMNPSRPGIVKRAKDAEKPWELQGGRKMKKKTPEIDCRSVACECAANAKEFSGNPSGPRPVPHLPLDVD